MKKFKVLFSILVFGLMLALSTCAIADKEGSGSSESGGTGGDAAEQTGSYMLDEKYDHVVNGMRLMLEYDKGMKAFVGTIENVTSMEIPRARLEVHQSNKIELGPTQPTNLSPGQTIDVKLYSEGTFDSWTAHPERGGGEGDSGEGSGEDSGEGSGEGSGESHGSGDSG